MTSNVIFVIFQYNLNLTVFVYSMVYYCGKRFLHSGIISFLSVIREGDADGSHWV
jgi:hypothetical protein